MWGKGKRESIPNLEVGYKFFPLARVGREEEGMGDFGSHQSAPVNTSEPENNHPTSQYGGKFLMFHRSGQMCLVAAPWQVGRFSGGRGGGGGGVWWREEGGGGQEFYLGFGPTPGELSGAFAHGEACWPSPLEP